MEICLSILTRYRNGQRSQRTRELMAAETASVVGCLAELGLADGEAEELVLRPVEAHLLACYGHEGAGGSTPSSWMRSRPWAWACSPAGPPVAAESW